jgi:hypothetical protein
MSLFLPEMNWTDWAFDLDNEALVTEEFFPFESTLPELENRIEEMIQNQEAQDLSQDCHNDISTKSSHKQFYTIKKQSILSFIIGTITK